MKTRIIKTQDKSAFIDVERLANDFDPDRNSEARKGFIEGLKTVQSLIDEKLVGNKQGSLDNFLLNSVLYTQEERELIMDAIYSWLQQTEK